MDRYAARDAARVELQNTHAAHARGEIDDRAWSQRVTAALASSYLADADDPRWQSGFEGDAALWREARELALDCVAGDGTFLDVGCATGHLMECVDTWARERGVALTVYGLELSPALAAAARRRLPAWRERVFEGNVIDWTPPQRFTYVRTGLEYVPAARRAELVRRLLRDVVAPGGRLIVGPAYGRDHDDALAAVRAAGLVPNVCARADRNGKTRYVLCLSGGSSF